MTTPPTPTVSAVEGLIGLVEAAEAVATGPCFCPGANNGPCRGCVLRAALARWRERAPLRKDGAAMTATYEPLFRLLNLGVAEAAPVMFAILDALDSLLPSPPTRGAP